MQKLKCIGGALNGNIVEIDNSYGEHDQVQLSAKIEFKITDFEEELAAFRRNELPKAMINPVYYYKVVVFHFPNNTAVRFLTPVNWSFEEAFRYVVGV